MNKCPNCGGSLKIKYNIKTCEYCRSVFTTEEDIKSRDNFDEGMLLLEHHKYSEASAKFNKSLSNVWSYVGLYICKHYKEISEDKGFPIVEDRCLRWFPYGYNKEDADMLLFFERAQEQDINALNALRNNHREKFKPLYKKMKEDADNFEAKTSTRTKIDIALIISAFVFVAIRWGGTSSAIVCWILFLIFASVPLIRLNKNRKDDYQKIKIKKRLNQNVLELKQYFDYD